jgi:hypothetical protein
MTNVFKSRGWYALPIIILGFMVISSICPKNEAPEVTVTAVPAACFFGQTSTITATATDPDGDALTYSWTQTGGTITSPTNTATITWEAPNSAGAFTITVTVNDGENTVSASVTITVTAPPAQWLKYDDENYEGYLETTDEVWFVLTLFDRPAGWVNYKVTEVRVYFNTDGDPDDVTPCLWNTIFDSGYYWPNTTVYDNEPEYDVFSGWNTYTVDWDLSLERFCAGYFQLYYATDPDPYFDDSDPDGRAYLIDGPDGDNLTAHLFTDIDWAIQVYVEPKTTPEGNAEGSEGMWLEGKKIVIRNREVNTQSQLLLQKKLERKETGMRKKF